MLLTPPETFKASVGAFLGGTSYTVTLRTDGLYYEARDAGGLKEKAVIHPSSEAWTKFLRQLNQAKLYLWAANYPNRADDGTQWQVVLVVGSRTVISQGANNYPKDGDESKPTNDPQIPSQAFNHFCEAVSELVGKPFH